MVYKGRKSLKLMLKYFKKGCIPISKTTKLGNIEKIDTIEITNDRKKISG